MGEKKMKYEVKIRLEPAIRGPYDDCYHILPNEFAPYLFRHAKMGEVTPKLWEGTISRGLLKKAIKEFVEAGGYFGKGDYWIRQEKLHPFWR